MPPRNTIRQTIYDPWNTRSFEAPTSAYFYPPQISHQNAALGSHIPPHLFTLVTVDTSSQGVTTGAPSMLEWSEFCTITYAANTIASNSNRLIEIAPCVAHVDSTTSLLNSSAVQSYRHHTPVSARNPPTKLEYRLVASAVPDPVACGHDRENIMTPRQPNVILAMPISTTPSPHGTLDLIAQ